MRILICNWKDLAHPKAGGAEVWTHGVARAWAANGHEVTLACSSAPGHPAEEVVDGVEVVRGGDYRFGVQRHARRLYEERSGRFDLVVDEVNTRPFAAPRWARRSAVVAMIHQVAREVWFHETPLPIALAGRYALEQRWLRPTADVRSTSRPFGEESLRLYGLRNNAVLPQGSSPKSAAPPRSPPDLRLRRPAVVRQAAGSRRARLREYHRSHRGPTWCRAGPRGRGAAWRSRRRGPRSPRS